MKQYVFNLDVSVGDRGCLVVHVQDATTHITHDMHYLLLIQAFAAEFYYQIEKGAICAELIYNTNLVHSWRHLLYLCLEHGDNVFMLAQLAL